MGRDSGATRKSAGFAVDGSKYIQVILEPVLSIPVLRPWKNCSVIFALYSPMSSTTRFPHQSLQGGANGISRSTDSGGFSEIKALVFGHSQSGIGGLNLAGTRRVRGGST
jgi:hypothetical protein